MSDKKISNSLKDKLARASELSQALANYKLLWAEFDEVVGELIDEGFVEAVFNGEQFALKDNFLDKEGNPKNTVFRPAGVKRFELKITKGGK